jgi:zinc transport system substrate-binding protein
MARFPLLSLGLVSLAVTACGDADPAATSPDVALRVAASFSPVDMIVAAVGGDRVDVVSLVPPGEEAHEYEPTAQQVADLERSDVVFMIGEGFQPNVEQLIEQLPASITAVDLLDSVDLLPFGEEIGEDGDEGHEGEDEEHGDVDPHVWLDPMHMAAMAASVEQALATADPDGAAEYAANAASLSAQLTELDTTMRDGLANCATTTLVTGHRAFGYLAAAYGLTPVAIAGISPSEEPTAETMADVAEYAADNGVTTIFFEENLPADLSETIAAEIGATTAVLDPLESLSSEQIAAGATYFSVMEENLAALRAGLQCS